MSAAGIVLVSAILAGWIWTWILFERLPR